MTFPAKAVAVGVMALFGTTACAPRMSLSGRPEARVVAVGTSQPVPVTEAPAAVHESTDSAAGAQTGASRIVSGVASYYSDALAGRPTASGEPYDPADLVAAHRELPFGTVLRVTNPANGRSVRVRVIDRGPSTKGRVLDVSRSAAEALGMIEQGVVTVLIEVLPPG